MDSLQDKKRKNREDEFESIEGGLEKEKFSEIQITGRKLNSSDEAYDPEHPGFDHSEGSRADSAAGIESHELLTLPQKKENFHVSAQDTEDFIPLFSPEHSDIEEDGFDSDECSEEKQIELFLGNKVSFVPVPQFAPSFVRYNQMKMDHLFASPHGSNTLDDSSIASPHGSNHSESPQPKGMYADNANKRASVFSRLNFSSKHITSGNKNRAKKKRHYKCEKMEMVTRQKLEIDGCSIDKRTSVFMRLTSASYSVDQQVHCMTGFKEGSGGWKKRKGKSIS